MKPHFLIIFSLITGLSFSQNPVKVAVAGLTHGHVDWIFNSEASVIQIVGVYETNPELVKRYSERYNLDSKLFYTDLREMLEQVKPEAVAAFGATSEHIDVVRAAAPLNIHVMVEKPLATTLEDAQEIAALAKKHNIHVLTNYETSWYASNRTVKELVEKGELGSINKVMVNSGHQGPKEIGVSEEFLEILIDPEMNGAGALFDFGCYGANLMTWLLNGERPVSVTAVVQQNKPEIYPEVDDDATIILQYESAQCVIQGSWNWTFSRKDMEVYGEKGYAIAQDANTVRQRLAEDEPEEITQLNPTENLHDDPFKFLAAVVRGDFAPEENNLYGLPVNLIVMEILEAARLSAEENRTVFLERM